jgi:hypothetical protein
MLFDRSFSLAKANLVTVLQLFRVKLDGFAGFDCFFPIFHQGNITALHWNRLFNL